MQIEESFEIDHTYVHSFLGFDPRATQPRRVSSNTSQFTKAPYRASVAKAKRKAKKQARRRQR